MILNNDCLILYFLNGIFFFSSNRFRKGLRAVIIDLRRAHTASKTWISKEENKVPRSDWQVWEWKVYECFMNQRDIIKALALTLSFRDVFFPKSVLIIERPASTFFKHRFAPTSLRLTVVNIKLSLLIWVSLSPPFQNNCNKHTFEGEEHRFCTTSGTK